MGHRFGCRWLSPALTVLLAVGALVACGGDDDGTAGDQTPAAAGERIQGGELTVQNFEPASLDPHFSAFLQDISLERMLWRGLYTLDIDNVPQPAMAASTPEVSDDGLTYTVSLREGLKWSDGDDLTADDFVAGIHRTCNPVNAGQYEYVLANIVGCDDHYANEAGYDPALEAAIGVTAADETTIEFTLLEPQPTFPIILSLWMTFPSPVHLLPNSSDLWPSGADAPAELAYNGPYILASYSPQDSVSLEPNPEWVAPAGVRPTLDRITMRFIDDLSLAANAYRTGELQAAKADATQLESLISEFGDGEEYFRFPAPATIGLFLQLKKSPLDMLEVRLALAQAIDREALNSVVYQGGNVPTTSWIPVVTGGHEPNAFANVVGFDPESAREHLAEAGFPDGEGFPDLTMLSIDSPQIENSALFLQQAFKTHLNIDVKIETVDSPTQADRFTEGQFDLTFSGWGQDYPDPENWILGQFVTGATLNNYNCSDPEIDELAGKAQFNPDNEERLRQYMEANELISTRLCGAIPYRHDGNHWLIKPDVVGMRENLAGQDANIAADWAAEYWGLSE